MRVLPRSAVPRRYHRAIGLGVAITLTAVIAACSADGDDGVLSPTSIARAAGADTAKPPRDTAKPPRDTTKPPRDTTKPPRDTTKVPRDTVDTMPPLPENVAVSGRVLGMVVIVPTPGVRDTLRFDPVANAKVRIMRNIIVNGASAQELAAELVSDANGKFNVSLKGGYYVVYAEPPARTIWNKSFAYLAATRPDVSVDVYLWKRGDG